MSIAHKLNYTMFDDPKSPLHKIQYLRNTEDELLFGSPVSLLCKHGSA